MTKEKTIETIYYQCGSQSLIYRELYSLDNKKKKPNKSIEASHRDFLQDFYMKKYTNQDIFELVA